MHQATEAAQGPQQSTRFWADWSDEKPTLHWRDAGLSWQYDDAENEVAQVAIEDVEAYREFFPGEPVTKARAAELIETRDIPQEVFDEAEQDWRDGADDRRAEALYDGGGF
jgi:hypothetical protein